MDHFIYYKTCDSTSIYCLVAPLDQNGNEILVFSPYPKYGTNLPRISTINDFDYNSVIFNKDNKPLRSIKNSVVYSNSEYESTNVHCIDTMSELKKIIDKVINDTGNSIYSIVLSLISSLAYDVHNDNLCKNSNNIFVINRYYAETVFDQSYIEDLIYKCQIFENDTLEEIAKISINLMQMSVLYVYCNNENILPIEYCINNQSNIKVDVSMRGNLLYKVYNCDAGLKVNYIARNVNFINKGLKCNNLTNAYKYIIRLNETQQLSNCSKAFASIIELSITIIENQKNNKPITMVYNRFIRNCGLPVALYIAKFMLYYDMTKILNQLFGNISISGTSQNIGNITLRVGNNSHVHFTPNTFNVTHDNQNSNNRPNPSDTKNLSAILGAQIELIKLCESNDIRIIKNANNHKIVIKYFMEINKNIDYSKYSTDMLLNPLNF